MCNNRRSEASLAASCTGGTGMQGPCCFNCAQALNTVSSKANG